jgi:hypothetical protein
LSQQTAPLPELFDLPSHDATSVALGRKALISVDLVYYTRKYSPHNGVTQALNVIDLTCWQSY